MKHVIFLALVFTCYNKLIAQQIKILTDNNKISIRGLCAVSKKVIWVSGNYGTVGRSTDGGKTWHWMVVKNFEQRDFRDIEAFDEKTAIIMAVAEPANILKTTNAGKTWKTVFTDSTKGMFLDAMAFQGDKAIVVGDPIDNKIFTAYSDDRGSSWKISTLLKDKTTSTGEAFFASSGTNVCLFGPAIPVFVSGGTRSRIYISSTATHTLPIVQGKTTTGANSIAMMPGKSVRGIIVGGDFAKDTARQNNCVLVTLFPFKSTMPTTPPFGYRSCVEYITENKLICCGTSGVDISTDGGMNWRNISTGSFHVCRKSKKDNTVFLAGINGKIAILEP